MRLRRFQHWSESQARQAGVTHVQHQLLVAIKGHPGDLPPSVGDIADYLLLRHHSAVELIDRAEAAGLVLRRIDPGDARVVRVELTGRGDRLVTDLTQAHLAQLQDLASTLNELVGGAGRGRGPRGRSPAPADTPGSPAIPAAAPSSSGRNASGAWRGWAPRCTATTSSQAHPG
ncbi:MAG: MarR family winged helix-turn-helix transcriptional regulator, partial [Streptosporangiaceae bacterium]